MKRIVKRTTTTEEWIDPGDEGNEHLDTASDEDDVKEEDAEQSEDQGDEAEDEPKPSRRRR